MHLRGVPLARGMQVHVRDGSQRECLSFCSGLRGDSYRFRLVGRAVRVARNAWNRTSSPDDPQTLCARFGVRQRRATAVADLPASLAWMLSEWLRQWRRSLRHGQPDLTFPNHTIQPVLLAPDPVLRFPVSQG